MTAYSQTKVLTYTPRLPLRGTLDLTYRCNNDCRHCWVRLDPGDSTRQQELTTEEIYDIVKQARALGCREWSISGGEPMLRPDFYEILDYITLNSKTYSLNTNGTLITPKIAQLLQERKGNKMIALYGATRETYERVSRVPGSYENAMRGFRLLREAGAHFVVQIIPMKSNYHEYQQMIELAKSLSPYWRIGAPWLYLSAGGDAVKNQEILDERLPAHVAVELDPPDVSVDDNGQGGHSCGVVKNGNIFESCIDVRRDFYIDPYGKLTFCSYIREPSLMADLRRMSVQEAWDVFIPSLKDKISGGAEHAENCGACERRSDCRWCAVYGYLEHGRFSAPVEYLCQVASESRTFKENWKTHHVKYYEIAGMTVKVEADLPITETTFNAKFKPFEVDTPGDDLITIRHHFELPKKEDLPEGKLRYRKPPWAVYENGASWIYYGISPVEGDDSLHRVVLFNQDHSRGRFYHQNDELFRRGGLHSLTMTATDQVMLSRVLADRDACYFHSSGIKYRGQGFVFIGHSEAGKSTMVKLMQAHSEILCDERIIVRRWPQGYKIHGNWSHGEIPITSPSSAPLAALLFIKQAQENKLEEISKAEAVRRMIACLIKPFETRDWWEKQLTLLEHLANNAPVYVLHFDLSGGVRQVLDQLL